MNESNPLALPEDVPLPLVWVRCPGVVPDDMVRCHLEEWHEGEHAVNGQVCETCRGSGMVAYGRWGSRPPRVKCKDCGGTGGQK